MTLTPIQQAMCAVIHQSGFQSLFNVSKAAGSKSIEISREEVPLPYSGDCYVRYEPGKWTIKIDSHTLTREEYNEWVKQQNLKNSDD